MHPDILGQIDPAGRGQEGPAGEGRSKGCNCDFLALGGWRRGGTAGTSGSAVGFGFCGHLLMMRDPKIEDTLFLDSKKDGVQFEQQNPKCQQFLLFATCQAPENHGCTLCCVLPTPNPVVFFPMGQQSAPRYLGSSNLAPIFGLESVVHGGPLQYIL